MLHLISFGSKYGPPKEADKIISVKHFENPSKEVRDNYTGTSKRLQKEIYAQPNFETYYSQILDRIRELSSAADDLVVGIGCEEGKHRSVAIVEKLTLDLKEFFEKIEIEHRDINRKKNEKSKNRTYSERRKQKYQNYSE